MAGDARATDEAGRTFRERAEECAFEREVMRAEQPTLLRREVESLAGLREGLSGAFDTVGMTGVGILTGEVRPLHRMGDAVQESWERVRTSMQHVGADVSAQSGGSRNPLRQALTSAEVLDERLSPDRRGMVIVLDARRQIQWRERRGVDDLPPDAITVPADEVQRGRALALGYALQTNDDGTITLWNDHAQSRPTTPKSRRGAGQVDDGEGERPSDPRVAQADARVQLLTAGALVGDVAEARSAQTATRATLAAEQAAEREAQREEEQARREEEQATREVASLRRDFFRSRRGMLQLSPQGDPVWSAARTPDTLPEDAMVAPLDQVDVGRLLLMGYAVQRSDDERGVVFWQAQRGPDAGMPSPEEFATRQAQLEAAGALLPPASSPTAERAAPQSDPEQPEIQRKLDELAVKGDGVRQEVQVDAQAGSTSIPVEAQRELDDIERATQEQTQVVRREEDDVERAIEHQTTVTDLRPDGIAQQIAPVQQDMLAASLAALRTPLQGAPAMRAIQAQGVAEATYEQVLGRTSEAQAAAQRALVAMQAAMSGDPTPATAMPISGDPWPTSVEAVTKELARTEQLLVDLARQEQALAQQAPSDTRNAATVQANREALALRQRQAQARRDAYRQQISLLSADDGSEGSTPTPLPDPLAPSPVVVTPPAERVLEAPLAAVAPMLDVPADADGASPLLTPLPPPVAPPAPATPVAATVSRLSPPAAPVPSIGAAPSPTSDARHQLAQLTVDIAAADTRMQQLAAAKEAQAAYYTAIGEPERGAAYQERAASQIERLASRRERWIHQQAELAPRVAALPPAATDIPPPAPRVTTPTDGWPQTEAGVEQELASVEQKLAALTAQLAVGGQEPELAPIVRELSQALQVDLPAVSPEERLAFMQARQQQLQACRDAYQQQLALLRRSRGAASAEGEDRGA